MAEAFTSVSASTKKKMSPCACRAPAFRSEICRCYHSNNLRALLPRHQGGRVTGSIIHHNDLMRLAGNFHPAANGRDTSANPGFLVMCWNDERNHLSACSVGANDPKLPATTWLDKSEVGASGQLPHPFTLDVVLYVMQLISPPWLEAAAGPRRNRVRLANFITHSPSVVCPQSSVIRPLFPWPSAVSGRNTHGCPSPGFGTVTKTAALHGALKFKRRPHDFHSMSCPQFL